MAKGTIARSGNSYVIRVPKSYVTDHGLRLGDKVDLPHPRAGQERAAASPNELGRTPGKTSPRSPKPTPLRGR